MILNMKFFKWFGITILVIIIMYIFSGTGPVRSAYSKKVLQSDPVFKGFNADCTYHKPSRLLETTNPHFSCISTKSFGVDDQVVEIVRLGKVLSSNGWVLTSKYHQRDVTYRKGKLKFNVQPYNWQPGLSVGEDPKLLIYFAHMTLSDFGN